MRRAVAGLSSRPLGFQGRQAFVASSGNMYAPLWSVHSQWTSTRFVGDSFQSYKTVTHMQNQLRKSLHENNIDEAVGCLEDLLASGTIPSDTVWTLVIRGCFWKDKELDRGFALADRMINASGIPISHPMVSQVLIVGSVRCNRMDLAFLLMNTCKQDGSLPTRASFLTVIEGCKKHNMLAQGKGYLEEMAAQGLIPSADLLASFIYACARAGKMKYASDIWELMHAQGIQPTEEMYLSVVEGCLKSNNIDVALGFLEAMQNQGVAPSARIFNLLIDAVVIAHKPDLAYSLYEQMKAQGLYPNLSVFGQLINGHVKAGQLDTAFAIFEEMKACGKIDVDEQPYNMLIDGCVKSGRYATALSLFDEMKSEGIAPSVVTYTILASSYAKRHELDKALSYLAEMKAVGIQPDSILLSTLISCCILAKDKEKVAALRKEFYSDVDEVLNRLQQQAARMRWQVLMN